MTNYEETMGKIQIEKHSTEQLAYTFKYILQIRLRDCINIS